MRTRRALFALLAICALAVSLDGSGPAPGANDAQSPRVTRQVAAAAADRAKATYNGINKRPARRASGVHGRGSHDGRGSQESASLSFAAPRTFATGAIPSSDAFNRTNGDGAINARVPVSDALAVGNFDEDSDGHLDVVQTNVVAGSLSVFRGDGRGGFSEPTVIRVGVTPAVIRTRDLDRDGHLDLVIVDPGANAVIILRGDGLGGFSIDNAIPVPPSPRDIALGDINADGIADFVVASRGPTSPFGSAPTGGATIFTGAVDESGAITFSRGQSMSLTKAEQTVGANAVALGDFDGSGGDDLAIAVGTSFRAGDRPAGATEPEGDDLLVYLNRNAKGGDAFASSPSQRLRVGAMPEAIAAADWNGDGHLDLAVMSTQSGDVTSLTNDGAGRFAVKDVNLSVGALPRTLTVADLNSDRIADLVTATFFMSTVSVLQGHGDGTFEPAADFWAGDAPTSVAVGLFDNDKRPDIVAARLRNDELALLVNDSARSDGVVATRDIPYVTPAGDPMAAHHTLDVWTPRAGTPSFAGRGKPYPVFIFAHGGGGFTGDKTMHSFLMRSLAREGIIGVSIDYRLDGGGGDVTTADYADAFRWVRAHIGAPAFGGDPDNIVVSGHSAGAISAVRLATAAAYEAEHRYIRGLFVLGATRTNSQDVASGLTPPPSLAMSGDQGGEVEVSLSAVAFVKAVQVHGVYAKFVRVRDRDHFTASSNLAHPSDHGRAELLRFLRRVTR